eukprot:SM000339S12960  [mRNA]  locus=s339:88111:88789:+ [translate_table: standard]
MDNIQSQRKRSRKKDYTTKKLQNTDDAEGSSVPTSEQHQHGLLRVDGVGKGALERYGQAHAEDLCERTGGIEAGHRPWQTWPPVKPRKHVTPHSKCHPEVTCQHGRTAAALFLEVIQPTRASSLGTSVGPFGRRSGSPNGGKGCEKPARKELTRFEGAKLRAKQRLRGLKRLWQNGGGPCRYFSSCLFTALAPSWEKKGLAH